MQSKEFIFLVDTIKSLPSIGQKAAERIAYFLLKQDNYYIDKFIKAINNARNNIKYCKQCNNFCYEELCEICSNSLRDKKKLCIVNNVDELNKIELTHAFNGIYFVLNDEINVKTKKPLSNTTTNKLAKYCLDKKFDEVIIATNFTLDGEATNIFLSKFIKNILTNVNIFKLAIGLPVNSALDYADELTLKFAFKNKTKII